MADEYDFVSEAIYIADHWFRNFPAKDGGADTAFLGFTASSDCEKPPDCVDRKSLVCFVDGRSVAGEHKIGRVEDKLRFGVAVAHTIWHVAATGSMSKVAVSFTHIIKSGEPAFSVLVSRFLMGETFPVPVYLSLIPINGGCGLAAVTELNFNMTGFMGAMISNLAFVFRNIFSKKGMKGKSVGGMNYYACLSLLSLLILTPFAIAVEGPQMWAIGWEKAVSQIGPQFIWFLARRTKWVAAQSVFYHLYNQVSYMSLNEISLLTFSIGNTMKRISPPSSSSTRLSSPSMLLEQPLPSSEASCIPRAKQ
ncbi:unnamed protein product [Camellia sinensis]